MLSISPSLPFPNCPEPFNLAAHVLRFSEKNADKIALAVVRLDGAERWSYAKLRSAVLGAATGLLQQGLKPGDRVLMRLGNTVEFPIAYLAAIAVGLVPVPTSSQLTETEVASIIKTLEPAITLLEPGVACPSDMTPVITVDELRRMFELEPASFEMGSPDRLAYIVYTSGTSGVPRAVMHAHRAIWARQMMVEDWYGLSETDRLMHAGAFNWTYTLGTGLMDPWAAGATALIPEAHVDPAQLPLLLKRFDATIFAAAPGVYRKFLSTLSQVKLPKLRHGLSAGEKLSDEIRAAWTSATGTKIYEAYGMSECSTFISAGPARPAPEGTLGFPQRGRQVALLTEDGIAPQGAEGTIAVHRSDPGLMLGYYGAKEDADLRFQGDWFLSGDQGVMTEDGAVTFLGRSDDMMNAGGFRVSPMEVERVLNAHAGITQSAVTEIEVKTDTRVIMAFYTGPKPIDVNELQDFAAERLARYKCPRAFYHLDTLPVGANNKILRRALKPIYEAKLGST